MSRQPSFPRVKLPPKTVTPREKLLPCVNCGKRLGSCRSGWCQRCVDDWIKLTTPEVEDLRGANEMLGRKLFPGDASRRLT